MRIESIDIKNYRQHKDLHLEFPKKKDTDLHVIIASNGVGKTNMMNAIIWCFYGIEPNVDNNSSAALPLCNIKGLEEARENGDTIAEVSVQIRVTANGETIVFTRKANVTVLTRFAQKPTFEVQVTNVKGDTEFLYNEEAIDRVNMYVPEKIRQYFFFDGEQLHNYFGPTQDTTHVKDSIYEIAQINIITAAKNHLNAVIAEYRQILAKANPQLQKITDDINSKITTRDQRKNDIKALNDAILDARQRIEQLNSYISGAESVVSDTKNFDSNENRIKELENSITKKRSELLVFVRKYYILLSMYRINERTKQYIADKDTRGKLPPDVDIALLRSSLTSHICAICNQPFSDDSEAVQHMNELLSRYEVSTDVSNKLSEIKNDVARFVDETHNYRTDKQKILMDIKNYERELSELREINEKLRVKIRGCSSTKQVADWMDERTNLQNTMRLNDQKIGEYKQMIKNLDDEIEDLYIKERKASDESKMLDETRAYKTFAEDALKIISSIESEIITDVKSQMEDETMRLFDSLVWKENTYGSIEFDNNFKLNLFSKKTGLSCIETTSAAERELLALAFTIALHRVSGHDSPLFIDTPVGRVSDNNRENFAQTLVDVSTQKQIVLAFTPSEYSDEIKGFFNSTTLSSQVKLGTVEEEVTIVEDKL